MCRVCYQASQSSGIFCSMESKEEGLEKHKTKMPSWDLWGLFYKKHWLFQRLPQRLISDLHTTRQRHKLLDFQYRIVSKITLNTHTHTVSVKRLVCVISPVFNQVADCFPKNVYINLNSLYMLQIVFLILLFRLLISLRC